jgi:hypothetical protein
MTRLSTCSNPCAYQHVHKYGKVALVGIEREGERGREREGGREGRREGGNESERKERERER